MEKNQANKKDSYIKRTNKPLLVGSSILADKTTEGDPSLLTKEEEMRYLDSYLEELHKHCANQNDIHLWKRTS